MTEAFLHYIWKMKLLKYSALKTISGEEISILKTGEHNLDAGPDFLNARIKIGNTTWAGSVEIHIKSSDWRKHKHSNDPAYDNVILHVVYENDDEILSKIEKPIHTVELKGKFDQKLFHNYERLQNSSSEIPCSTSISGVREFTIKSWLSRMLIDRLEEKSSRIETSFTKNKGDWEVTFYHQLARAFGTRLNGDAFQQTAETLPLQVLAKNKNNLLILESLLFGCAGWLDGNVKDEYMLKLRKEFLFQQKKFSLSAIQKQQWKLLRLRPANFPTQRLAQFAALVHQSSHLFSKILNTESVSSLRKYFKVKSSPYWETHLLPGKNSAEHSTLLTDDFIDLLLINTVIPVVFYYGKIKDDDALKNKALNWLDSIPSENNFIIREWKEAGVKSKSAYDSQALLHLRKNLCSKKLCLHCGIGHSILKNI